MLVERFYNPAYFDNETFRTLLKAPVCRQGSQGSFTGLVFQLPVGFPLSRRILVHPGVSDLLTVVFQLRYDRTAFIEENDQGFLLSSKLKDVAEIRRATGLSVKDCVDPHDPTVRSPVAAKAREVRCIAFLQRSSRSLGEVGRTDLDKAWKELALLKFVVGHSLLL
ncbi:hypothetical protein [Pararhizobium sp. PWRC1-1]|uniref:hypothetical protein n=1 Tax=Pararhizobium sp. PWRC1-1 TaxID=2804566 RepID=UPI003CF7C252